MLWEKSRGTKERVFFPPSVSFLPPLLPRRDFGNTEIEEIEDEVREILPLHSAYISRAVTGLDIFVEERRARPRVGTRNISRIVRVMDDEYYILPRSV